MDKELMDARDRFVSRYNAGRSADKAAWDALISALQRNRTYGATASWRERKKFRDFWTANLVELSAKYRDEVELAQFKSDVEFLKQRMNEGFGRLLCEDGFRISHSQKSLSVYLKHLWCIDLISEPPACPVDRIILGVAKAPESSRTWTTVNTISEYERQLKFVEQRASDEARTLAAWELINFPVRA